MAFNQQKTIGNTVQSPAVSIVLPFYNAADTLEECLDSIARQRLQTFEVLAIDDGSGDDGAAIVQRYARSDARIRLLQPGRIGLVAALNLGLEASRASLVARMDADDRMHPDRLALQHAFLANHPDIVLVGSRVRLFPGERIQAGYREYMRWQNQCLSPQAIARDIYIESPFAHPSVMLRRATVQALGGYRNGDFPEDYELWLRMHAAGCKMAKLSQTLLDWRDSDTRLSRTDPAYARSAFDRLRAHYLARDPRLPAARDLVFWGAGRRTRKRAHHLIAQGFTPSAWIDIDSRKIGNLIRGARVQPPTWLQRQPRPFVLCYVANHGARDEIGEALGHMGYSSPEDYLMVG